MDDAAGTFGRTLEILIGTRSAEAGIASETKLNKAAKKSIT